MIFGTSAQPYRGAGAIGKPEPLGVFDDHDGRGGHVDADLDDRGCDEDLDGPGAKGGHCPLPGLRLGPSVDQRAGNLAKTRCRDHRTPRPRPYNHPVFIPALNPRERQKTPGRFSVGFPVK